MGDFPEKEIMYHIGAAKIVVLTNVRGATYMDVSPLVSSLIFLYLKKKLGKEDPEKARYLLRRFRFECVSGLVRDYVLYKCGEISSELVERYHDIVLFLYRIPRKLVAEYEKLLKNLFSEPRARDLLLLAGEELLK